MVIRSRRKTEQVEKLLSDTNNCTVLKNIQNIVTTETKNHVPEDVCGRIQSESKDNCAEESFNDTNNVTIPQNTNDILPTKNRKRTTDSAMPSDVHLKKQCHKVYACEYSGCSAVYDRPFRLARHIRSHTGERPYKCDHAGCDKRYMSLSHLKRHAETHDNVYKGLQCNQCFIIVRNYHNLARHYKRVHANPLRCKECFALFKKKHHLTLHMDKHLGITTYKCSQCNKMFDSMRKLKRHEGFHEGKGYRCPIPECSEIFDKWSLLRKHKVQHNDHTCKICGKQFKRNATLKLHAKTHTERISILCPYDECNRTYARETSLKNHIRVRHLNHKFVCDICKKTYMAKHTLKTHIMKWHLGINVKNKIKKSKRKQRIDAGIPRKSMVTQLTGLKFVHHVDKELLERKCATELVA